MKAQAIPAMPRIKIPFACMAAIAVLSAVELERPLPDNLS